MAEVCVCVCSVLKLVLPNSVVVDVVRCDTATPVGSLFCWQSHTEICVGA